MEFDFDKIFKSTVIALKINRTHPSITRTKLWVAHCMLIQSVYTMVFIFFLHSIKCDLARRDFSATCRNGCLSVVYFAITFQYLTTLVYRDTITKLMNIMKADYERVKNLPEDAEVVALYAKKGGWVTQLWFVTAGVAFIMFPVKNIVLYIVQFVRRDEFKLIAFYELTYPEVIEENKNHPLIYTITYICLIFYAAHSSTTYIAFVPLGPMFMLHACGQLELIKRRIDKLFDGSLSSEEINTELKDIVRNFHLIYSFVDDIKSCVRVVYELVLKSNAIIMPVTAYEVIESINKGGMSIDFIMFIIGGIVISATPCYYSDVIMSKSEEVCLTIYTCGWERQYDRRSRSTLLILLTRSIRPMAIRTMFRTICLDALTDLYQQSYAIFSLMNAMFH